MKPDIINIKATKNLFDYDAFVLKILRCAQDDNRAAFVKRFLAALGMTVKNRSGL